MLAIIFALYSSYVILLNWIMTRLYFSLRGWTTDLKIKTGSSILLFLDTDVEANCFGSCLALDTLHSIDGIPSQYWIHPYSTDDIPSKYWIPFIVLMVSLHNTEYPPQQCWWYPMRTDDISPVLLNILSQYWRSCRVINIFHSTPQTFPMVVSEIVSPLNFYNLEAPEKPRFLS